MLAAAGSHGHDRPEPRRRLRRRSQTGLQGEHDPERRPRPDPRSPRAPMPKNLVTGQDAAGRRRVRRRGRRARAARRSRRRSSATTARRSSQSECASCHTLKAAGATGTIGPNLDQLKPSQAVVEHQVEVGGGVMPAFKGTLTARRSQPSRSSSPRPPASSAGCEVRRARLDDAAADRGRPRALMAGGVRARVRRRAARDDHRSSGGCRAGARSSTATSRRLRGRGRRAARRSAGHCRGGARTRPGELRRAVGDLRAPEAWGSGAGTALLAAGVEELRRQGYAEASLWVLEDNPRARRFYEREGWTLDGARKEDEFLGVVTELASALRRRGLTPVRRQARAWSKLGDARPSAPGSDPAVPATPG